MTRVSERVEMEYNKKVSNPMLVGAIELTKAERTPEHQKLVTEEIFKAVFLSPARVTPAPETDGMKVAPHMQVLFPKLEAPGGLRFYMAFTDAQELHKWPPAKDWQSVTMTFEDYAKMMFREDARDIEHPVVGVVINPFSSNIIIYKDKMAQYISLKMDQAYRATKKSSEEPK